MSRRHTRTSQLEEPLESQESRLQQLEEELRHMTSGRHRKQESVPAEETPSASHPFGNGLRAYNAYVDDVLERSQGADSEDAANDGRSSVSSQWEPIDVPTRRDADSSAGWGLHSAALGDPRDELRGLVPLLSPSFDCSAQDAALIIASIHTGGPRTFTQSEPDSLADKILVLEASKRAVEHKLEHRDAECEQLATEVMEWRQKLAAHQQETKQTTGLLSQRREDMRKQLLLEESRNEKLQIKNRQLEMEVNRLKNLLDSSRQR